MHAPILPNTNIHTHPSAICAFVCHLHMWHFKHCTCTSACALLCKLSIHSRTVVTPTLYCIQNEPPIWPREGARDRKNYKTTVLPINTRRTRAVGLRMSERSSSKTILYTLFCRHNLITVPGKLCFYEHREAYLYRTDTPRLFRCHLNTTKIITAM